MVLTLESQPDTNNAKPLTNRMEVRPVLARDRTPFHVQQLSKDLLSLLPLLDEFFKKHSDKLSQRFNYIVFLTKRLKLTLSHKAVHDTVSELVELLPQVRDVLSHLEKFVQDSLEVQDAWVYLTNLEHLVENRLDLLYGEFKLYTNQGHDQLLLRNVWLLSQKNVGPARAWYILNQVAKLAVELDESAVGFSHVLSQVSPVAYARILSLVTPHQVLALVGARSGTYTEKIYQQDLNRVLTLAASFHPATSPLSKPVNWWPEIW